MGMRVVPHPKLKRDYQGRRVRTKEVMHNGWVQIPAGALAIIDQQSPKGSVLLFDACACCGMRARISAVGKDDIEFVEPVDREDASGEAP